MAFGGNDAQASQLLHALVLHRPLSPQLHDARLLGRSIQRLVGLHGSDVFLYIAPKHDVGTAPRHVGGNGDHAGAPSLGHDVGFTRVLLGVEHLVGQAHLVEHFIDDFRVLDRRGAHQHRLAPLVAFTDIGDRSLVLFARSLVHAVKLVFPPTGPVRRNDHRFQAVDFLKFVGFGIGRTSHAGQLVVQAEVVLERDGGQRLVFGLNLHPFLGFHGLVQTFAPASACHQAAGEFVNDDDLAVLHHVMLVAVVQMVGTQRSIQMVHQRDVGRVVERRAFGNQALVGQHALGCLVALLGQEDLVRLLIHREVARLDHALTGTRVGLTLLAHHQRHHLVHGDVHRRVVFCLATDDERRACLINQDRIDFVNDGVVEPALHPVARLVDHVVTQVVKAVFVVRSVRDVGTVGGLLFLAWHVGQVDAYAQAKEVVEARHPLRVAVGKVVVDRHHVRAVAGKRIEVHGQGRRKRLALAGSHLGNLAKMQRNAADQLHVEVPHLHHALGAFPHYGKGLGQQRIEMLAACNAGLELVCFGAKRLVAQRFVGGLEFIDACHRLAVLLEQAVIAAAENFGEEVGGHADMDLSRHSKVREKSVIPVNKWVR